MYELYQRIIYNEFLKEQRKKRKLTIAHISKKISYSPGAISLIENNNDLLSNTKVSFLLKEYGYDQDFLIQFDYDISKLFDKFINAILFVKSEYIEEAFHDIKNYLIPHKDSVLYSSYYLAEFIYLRHTKNYTNNNTFVFLCNHINLFNEKYQSLIFIYCISYSVYNKNLMEAKKYFDKASSAVAIDKSFEGMYHYFSASYYIWMNDIPNSIYHCEKAISLFTKSQNYKRLVGTNIIVANQYLKLKQYSKSFDLNLSVYNYAIENMDLFNQRVSLNNMGFIKMMQSEFDEAASYFQKIPEEYLKENHYQSYMICLGEIDDIENCKRVCLEGKQIAITPYYQYMFKIYEKYTDDGNLKRLSAKIEKVFEKYDDYLDIFEREFLCVLLGNQYKKLGNIKKALEYYEKLHELSYI